MKLKSIHIKNFRSLKDCSMQFDDITTIIGPNGVGKTTFLDALYLFYEEKSMNNYNFIDQFFKSIGPEDPNENDEISIKVCFTIDDDTLIENNLSMNHNIQNILTIEKTITLKKETMSTSCYKSLRKTNPAFKSFRDASGSKIRAEYKKLKDGDYKKLPDYSSKEIAYKHVDDYEDKHVEMNTEEISVDFSFDIKKLFTVIYVPASNFVKIGSDSIGRDDVEFRDLADIDTLVFSYWRDRYQDMYDKVEKIINEKTSKLFKKSKLDKNLEKNININLEKLVHDSKVVVKLEPTASRISFPKLRFTINENDNEIPLNNAGQGLHRSFIISILQTLSESYKEDSSTSTINLRIIMIDEPELFQHPNQQRHFYDVLRTLSRSSQVIYCTHSPYFISLKNFNNVRKISKNNNIVEIKATSFDSVLKKINKDESSLVNHISDKSYFQIWLDNFADIKIIEGFFAKAVVLVEGYNDYKPLRYLCDLLKPNALHMKNITIIPCGGKLTLNRFASIFQDLDIPCYVIWDSDKKYKPKENQSEKDFCEQRTRTIKENQVLLLCMNSNIKQEFPSTVKKNFACFQVNMPDYIRNSIGESDFKKMKTRQLCSYDTIEKIMDNSNNTALPKLQKIAKKIFKLV